MSTNIFTYRDDKTGFDAYMIRPYQEKINCPLCNTKFISNELFTIHLELGHNLPKQDDEVFPIGEPMIYDKKEFILFRGPTKP